MERTFTELAGHVCDRRTQSHVPLLAQFAFWALRRRLLSDSQRVNAIGRANSGGVCDTAYSLPTGAASAWWICFAFRRCRSAASRSAGRLLDGLLPFGIKRAAFVHAASSSASGTHHIDRCGGGLFGLPRRCFRNFPDAFAGCATVTGACLT